MLKISFNSDSDDTLSLSHSSQDLEEKDNEDEEDENSASSAHKKCELKKSVFKKLVVKKSVKIIKLKSLFKLKFIKISKDKIKSHDTALKLNLIIVLSDNEFSSSHCKKTDKCREFTLTASFTHKSVDCTVTIKSS